ncbi:MAG TPA: hypothetical protein VIB11_12935 [Pedococcus sp.]
MRTFTARSVAARPLVVLTWMLLWFGAFSLFGMVRERIDTSPIQLLLGILIFSACLGLGFVLQRRMLSCLGPATATRRRRAQLGGR